MFTKPMDCDKILLYFCNAFLTLEVRNRTCGVVLIRSKADVRFVVFVKARAPRLSASADREGRLLLMRSGNRKI